MTSSVSLPALPAAMVPMAAIPGMALASSGPTSDPAGGLAGAAAPLDFAALMQSLGFSGAGEMPQPEAATDVISELSGEAQPQAVGEPPAAAILSLLSGLPGNTPAETRASTGTVAPNPLLGGKQAKAPKVMALAADAADLGKADQTDLTKKPAVSLLAAEEAAKLADADTLAADSKSNSSTSAGQFTSLLASASSSATPARGAAALGTPVHIQSPVGSPNWSQEIGQRLVWLTRNDNQMAQISLNPAHLGPVEVRLSLTADQATAVFSSPHSEIREALEAALPRLREMFAGAGIELGQAQVNSQSREQMAGDGRNANRANADPGAILGADSADKASEVHVRPLARGLVDTFA